MEPITPHIWSPKPTHSTAHRYCTPQPHNSPTAFQPTTAITQPSSMRRSNVRSNLRLTIMKFQWALSLFLQHSFSPPVTHPSPFLCTPPPPTNSLVTQSMFSPTQYTNKIYLHLPRKFRYLLRMRSAPTYDIRQQTFFRNQFVILYVILFIYCNWVVTRWQWLFYM